MRRVPAATSLLGAFVLATFGLNVQAQIDLLNVPVSHSPAFPSGGLEINLNGLTSAGSSDGGVYDDLFAVSEYGLDNGASGACIDAGGCGAVIKISPGRYRILHQFLGGTDGAGPVGPVVEDSAGDIYGVTRQVPVSFSSNEGLYGEPSIFRLVPQPDGSYSLQTIYQGFVQPGVLLGSDGKIYASTYNTVIQLSPPVATNSTLWNARVLSYVSGIINGQLAEGSKGTIYGTTYNGGRGFGTVFSLTPPAVSPPKGWAPLWQYHLLHSFTGGSDGQYPEVGVTVGSLTGNVYGTTDGDPASCPYAGAGPAGPGICGTVFMLTDTSNGWSFSLLHSFASQSDGASPRQRLAVTEDPVYPATIFGTTSFAGSYGFGTAFRIVLPSSGGVSYSNDQLDIYHSLSSNDGQVVADPSGLGEYTGGNFKVFDVRFPIDVPAATTGAGVFPACLTLSESGADGSVTVHNTCNRSVWYWGVFCGYEGDGNCETCPPTDCAPGILRTPPDALYVGANQSAVFYEGATPGSGISFWQEIWECPAGTYPFYQYTSDPQCGPAQWN